MNEDGATVGTAVGRPAAREDTGTRWKTGPGERFFRLGVHHPIDFGDAQTQSLPIDAHVEPWSDLVKRPA